MISIIYRGFIVIKTIIASIASGLLATLLTLWWTSVDQVKSTREFEETTTANIKALEKKIIGIERGINSLITASGGLDEKVKSVELNLVASAQTLKSELATYTDSLKAGLEVQVASKYKDLNAINVPDRTLVSNKTYHEGNRFYLLSKQLLVHVTKVSKESRLASFKIIYPDKTEVLLKNVAQGGRANFDFQHYTYMLDVGYINSFIAQNGPIKIVELTISRASM